MNTKIIEGLVGANNNISLSSVPMRVYNEARSRGDVDVMGRAMEYFGKSIQKVNEYSKKADIGMKEEVEKAIEEKRLERENEVENINQTNLDQKEEARVPETDKDVLNLSVEGRAMLEDQIGQSASTPKRIDKTNEKPIIYTKTGEINTLAKNVIISVSV